jgi:hypothetical protein
MAEGVAAIQAEAEVREAVKTLRDLVWAFGLSWDEDALYIVEHELGFPMGDESVEVGGQSAG